MGAVIGICGFEKNNYIGVPRKYVECIYKAGGTPLILHDKLLLAEEYINIVHGIMFVGGGDIAAHYFLQEQDESASGIDPERDAFELMICRLAYRKGIPIFGICRGCQTINVALGGDLIQDIPGHMASSEAESHPIRISEESILFRAFGEDRINVNSYHHQSCGVLAKGLRVTAISGDGIIEAFECDHTYISAVQFHPERMIDADVRFLELFCDFVNACERKRKKC